MCGSSKSQLIIIIVCDRCSETRNQLVYFVSFDFAYMTVESVAKNV